MSKSNQHINTSAHQLIKITSKGKVSIVIGDSLKPFFLNILEDIQHRNAHVAAMKLTEDIAMERMRLCAINEIYVRHFTMLSMINQPGRLLITWAQALALWTYYMDYFAQYSKHPELGNLFMQLHQKLT